VEEGTVSITLGTSGVVFATSDQYRADPDGRLHAFCHAVPDSWHLMGVMLSAAGSLRWFRDVFLPDNPEESNLSYAKLVAEAQSVSPGADGLLFLPYLSGERTPHADPNAKGVFFGLHLGHDREHLTRSVLEGVSFGLRDSMELMNDLGLSAEEIRVSGGGARSNLWRQILADVLNVRLVHTTVPHGAAVGAALLAGVGAGTYDTVAEASRTAYREAGSTTPARDRDLYDSLYERFTALYPDLEDHFDALADVVDQMKAESDTA
jgi:xylulokinase